MSLVESFAQHIECETHGPDIFFSFDAFEHKSHGLDHLTFFNIVNDKSHGPDWFPYSTHSIGLMMPAF